MDIIILFVLCFIAYRFMKSAKFNIKSIFKFTPKMKGDELTIMSKKCEVCGTKTIYLKGDDTSSLNMINIADPDTGEVTTKFACDKCYNEIMAFMKQEKKDTVTVSKELKTLVDMIKNS